MDEEITRVAKVGIKALGILKLAVADSGGVVPNSEILLKRLQEEIAAKIGSRIVVGARGLIKPIPVASGLELSPLGCLVKPVEHPAFVQPFRAGKPLSAAHIQSGNVISFDCLERASNELSQFTHACAPRHAYRKSTPEISYLLCSAGNNGHTASCRFPESLEEPCVPRTPSNLRSSRRGPREPEREGERDHAPRRSWRQNYVVVPLGSPGMMAQDASEPPHKCERRRRARRTHNTPPTTRSPKSSASTSRRADLSPPSWSILGREFPATRSTSRDGRKSPVTSGVSPAPSHPPAIGGLHAPVVRPAVRRVDERRRIPRPRGR